MNKRFIRFFALVLILSSSVVIAQNQPNRKKEREEQSLQYDEYGFESNLGEYLVDD